MPRPTVTLTEFIKQLQVLEAEDYGELTVHEALHGLPARAWIVDYSDDEDDNDPHLVVEIH